MWYLTTYQMRINFHVHRHLIISRNNFASRIARKQDSQFKNQDQIKICLKPKSVPKWQTQYKHLNNTRQNHARSQVRWRTRCNIIADWLKVYKLVAEWLCANIRYGTCAIAYISASHIQKYKLDFIL